LQKWQSTQSINAARKSRAYRIKQELYDNIVITGGTSMMPGLVQRMDIELKKAAKDPSSLMQVYSDSHRKYAAWIGGSMLSSFSTFGQFIITRSQYEENGATGASMILNKAF
jgi:actin beta/gamma 1